MLAFEKAVDLIEKEAKANGGYPIDIELVKYDNYVDFLQAFPDENYDDHLKQRAALEKWCHERGIKVVDKFVDMQNVRRGKAGAKARARDGMLPPYRLGLEVGPRCVAHMLVELDPKKKNAYGDMKPIGLGGWAARGGNR